MDTRFFRYRHNPSLQRFIINRGKPIKERLNHMGGQVHHENAEEKQEDPYPEPPVIRTTPHKPETCEEDKRSNYCRKNQRFKEIRCPEAERHGIESMSVLYTK